MGTSTTAGNTGQLVGVTGAISGQTESSTYGFDLIGRLVTSSQTSNGVTAQRRFAYDRWGNRTGEWDAVSGGNQIQSVTFQQSGGAPTNQIQSVTTAGTPANYSYDNAGNVTNDGVHTYGYDGADRLVSVDAGVTSQSAYDYRNRRVKKVLGSATTHYVWNGSLVLAEHNGLTGASITDYVYAHQALVATISGSVVEYSVRDRLSERMSLDSSGNVLGVQSHLPFGEDFAESGTQEKHHFTTYERDSETGGDYAMNREYSSGLGRFGGVDAAAASPRDPQTFNRYAYTRNNPVEYVDPQGLGCQEWLHIEYWQGDDGGIVVDWSNTYVYEMCSTDDAQGSGGSVGGVGGTGGQLKAACLGKTQKADIKNYLNGLPQACKDALTKSFGADIFSRLSSAVDSVIIVDTNSISSQNADAWFFGIVDNIINNAPAGDQDKYRNMTVGQFFTPGFVPESLGGTPQILTVPDKEIGKLKGIFAPGGLDNPGFDSDVFDPVMTEELVHYVTKASDSDLQKLTGGKDFAAWIAGGCK